MHEAFNTQVEVQTQIFIWSDFLDQIISDQTFQAEITPDQTFQTQSTSDQTIQTEGVLIRPSSDHGAHSNSDTCPDITHTLISLECVRSGYDQTQLRSKHLWSDPVALAAIYDQTEARSKLVLIRLKCARNTLIREWFYL